MSRTKKLAVLAVVSLSALLVAGPASAAPRHRLTNEELVTYVYNELFTNHNTAVIDQFVNPSYKQHNPTLPDGIEPLRQLIERRPLGARNVVRRVVAEGDLVLLESDAQNPAGVSTRTISDLFRVRDGQIVEHWDVLRAIPATTASGNDLYSTLSQPQVSTPLPFASTEHSEQVLESYFTRLYQNHDTAAITRFLANPFYQHAPTLPNGAAAVRTAFEAQLAANPDMIVSSAKVIAQGDLVAVRYHFQASPADLGQAVVDIYRVRGNKIVEHWDVTQAVPATSANSNTMF